MQFSDIYRDKKVFVTGHTGFKGTWLISWLHLLGAQVKGYSLAPQNPFDLYHIMEGDKMCDSVISDIMDGERLKQELLEFEPDFVFHLAAQPLVRLSYDIPVETFAVNAVGTANVLDALRFLKNPCVAVFITTDKVYHNIESNYYYKEDDRLGGFDPYSASKACAELVIDSYRNSFFNLIKFEEHKKSISVTRAGNVIGGGDWAKDRIIPDIVRALSTGKEVLVRNPAAVRPWQHVMEPVGGYLMLGARQYNEPKKFAQAFNFGPDKEDNLTVKEVVQKAIDVWGTGIFHTPEQLEVPHEAGLLQLDIQKAKTELGWKPKLNANQAILETINWYKHYFKDQSSIKEFTFQTIQAFDGK
ncbi:CDP-glucose 4,6-dehydratase [Filimonas effusa]|uniref:CDP-glucose 4,6-dehydratase n=1 Tax=Filimonas effusa TaxID=2508721 RepID=A0A4V1MAX1_9BACT|nr:CDP-glucose 4,6-dehydratase [Filimonas effusa]RXK87356.1 CDP-glucose 4,6-dehydratase [Filimonas effusa]